MWQSVGSGSLCPFSVQSSTMDGGVGPSVATPRSQKGADPMQGCDGTYSTPEAWKTDHLTFYLNRKKFQFKETLACSKTCFRWILFEGSAMDQYRVE